MKYLSNNVVLLLLLVLAAVMVALVSHVLWPEQPDSSGQTVSIAQSDRMPAQQKRVLIIHSYHPEYPWVESISQGIAKGLEESASEIRTFYMDTKRNNDESSKIAAGERAMQMVAEWDPNLIIAVDDNAQKYAAMHYAGRDEIQVVFCGVNGDTRDYGYPAKNITGVLERPYFEETLKFLELLRPGFRKIALISEESETSDLAFRFMKPADDRFEVTSYCKCRDFAQWQKAVMEAQDKADAIGVYTYHSLKRTGTDENMPHIEVMQWTLENSTIPVVGFLDFAVEDGALCGMVECGYEQGLRAGQLGRLLLSGRKASEFQVVETGLHGRKLFNADTARKYGISVDSDIMKLVEVVRTDKK